MGLWGTHITQQDLLGLHAQRPMRPGSIALIPRN